MTLCFHFKIFFPKRVWHFSSLLGWLLIIIYLWSRCYNSTISKRKQAPKTWLQNLCSQTVGLTDSLEKMHYCNLVWGAVCCPQPRSRSWKGFPSQWSQPSFGCTSPGPGTVAAVCRGRLEFSWSSLQVFDCKGVGEVSVEIILVSTQPLEFVKDVWDNT